MFRAPAVVTQAPLLHGLSVLRVCPGCRSLATCAAGSGGGRPVCWGETHMSLRIRPHPETRTPVEAVNTIEDQSLNPERRWKTSTFG
jgi:hypothetical protein